MLIRTSSKSSTYAAFLLAGVSIRNHSANIWLGHLAHGSAPFGFGLWTVSGWLVLSRVTGFFAGEEAPCTKQMAMHLQQIDVLGL